MPKHLRYGPVRSRSIHLESRRKVIRGACRLYLGLAQLARGGFVACVAIFGTGLVLFSTTSCDRVSGTVSAITLHDPIHIIGNEGFTSSNGVKKGDGTSSDPYMIEGWEIISPDLPAIWIENTDSHFVVKDDTIHSSHIELSSCSNGSILTCDVKMTSSDTIALWSCDNIKVSGCSLSSGGYDAGVRVHTCMNIDIRNCDISDCYWGVFVYDLSSYINITDNHIARCTYKGGIVIHNSDHVTLSRNTLVSAGVGVTSLSFDGFQTLTIDVSNSVDGRPVYFFKNLAGVTIDRIAIGELIVACCSEVRVSNLSFSDAYDGIMIAYSHAIIITNCVFTSVGNDAITLQTCTNATVLRNHLVSSQVYGIYVDTCNDVIAMCNTLSLDSPEGRIWGSGMLVVHSSDVMLRDNRVVKNWRGIEAWGCDNIDITRNAMIGIGFDGIALSESTYVRITANLITMSGEKGLGLHSSSHVTVSSNSFVENAGQIFLDNSDFLTWNETYPAGGNYWSDYSGTDISRGSSQNVPGSDGIGDSPYVIDASNSDRYPLMFSRIPNLAPVAFFSVHPISGNNTTVFEVDSTSSWDLEDLNGSLLVRWDWESDGKWDTEWATNKTAEHSYSSEGNYSLRLEVIDSGGLTDSFSVLVTVQLPREKESGDHANEIVAVVLAAGIIAVAFLVLWKRKKTP